MIRSIKKIGKFGISGLICTTISYGVFVFSAAYVHYLIANFLSWVFGLSFGFILHRNFTFGLKGRRNINSHAIAFFVGSIGQFMLASFGYWFLIGIFGIPAYLAFPINLFITASAMYVYLDCITFRERV